MASVLSFKAVAQDPSSLVEKGADSGWEVVVVRPNDPANAYGGYQWEGRDVLIRRETVQSMLLFAYALNQSQLENVPDWAKTELWDAKGHAGGADHLSRDQMQSLIRKLLAERFGLVMHMVHRVASVYMLTVAKGGATMAASTRDPNGLSSESDRENGGLETIHAENMTIGELSELLMRIALDHPAVDMTDLRGRYDFDLGWTTDDALASAAPDAPPGLFMAIQEQIGLRLEAVKAMADVLVIDKVERPKTN
ncbi:MAG TPA: TIGR03435 family protein [Terriglobales bacterium]|nr:TIGR03435 family protein [Terriglobales bacterium]